MKREIIARLHGQFEEYAHQIKGVECWYARELQNLLGYNQWRSFEQVIGRATAACANAGQRAEDHFAYVRKMVDIGSDTQREVDDIAA